MERRLRCLVLLQTILSCNLLSHAQTATQPPAPTDSSAALDVGRSVFPLYGPWRFHTGDSPIDAKTGEPQWAEPDFDDSKWETVDLTPHAGVVDPFTRDPRYVQGWTAKGHPGYWGYAWYRIRVPVSAASNEQLALLTYGWVDDGYQLFDNGRLLGSWGKFSEGKWPVVYFTRPAMFVLPPLSTSGDLRRGPAEQTLAFRMWMGPVRLAEHPFTGGLHYAPLLGEAGAIRARADLEWMELVRNHITAPLAAGLFFLLAIVAATLILFDRSDPVYLWVAAGLLLMGIDEIFFSVANWTQWESLRTFFLQLQVFSFPLMFGAWAMAWWVWFKLREPRWIPKAIVVLTALNMLGGLLGKELLHGMIPHAVGVVFLVIRLVTQVLLLAVVLLIVGKGIREQGWEGWFVLPPVLLLAFAQFQDELIKLHWHGTFSAYGVVFFYSELANLLLAGAVALLLLRRLLLSVRNQRQMALDVKQAQEVQQVILPVARMKLPGLEIESEYRPAREVGGDFFQIIPNTSDDSVLIVAGDVTGKGLKAGMLVALLVGATRTAARFNPDPLAVLIELNQRLLGRADAQATCLALRIEADGSATLANAGHVPPYLNGEPIAMEGALPLGMTEDAEHSVTRFKLEDEDRLVLISDGVCEAMDAQRELFGFERIHDLLRTATTAAEIASAAQAFGQEDDISVISVARTPVSEHAAATESMKEAGHNAVIGTSPAATT
ncbi:MAG TPA: SpoIIE family protein phosphatase [Candidatus Aquilonibacter sp.]|nr:SpoIIE family protein phosphatase [Candidatus Aquilonibacter sp.]